MPKSQSAKLDEDWIVHATRTIRKYESIIRNTDPLQIVVVRIDGVPCAFFKPPGKLCIVPGRSGFEENCLNAMATFWCHHEYERRKHNQRVALLPNTTDKPVRYEYGGLKWQYYKTKLRSNLFTV